jgi:uncharacterized protein
MTIKEIFEKYKTIAVYGMSKNPAKAANYVPAYLRGQGYNIIPINPTANEIDGLRCYPKLADVPDKIEILNVFRPSEDALDAVIEAVERKRTKGDIELIWLQEGIINDDAKLLAETNGIAFVQDKCMLKEHKRF